MIYGEVVLLVESKEIKWAIVQEFVLDQNRHANLSIIQVVPLKKTGKFLAVKLDQIKCLVHIVPDFSLPDSKTSFLVNHFT